MIIFLAIFSLVLTAVVSICITITWLDFGRDTNRELIARGLSIFLCFTLGNVVSQLFKALAAIN